MIASAMHKLSKLNGDDYVSKQLICSARLRDMVIFSPLPLLHSPVAFALAVLGPGSRC